MINDRVGRVGARPPLGRAAPERHDLLVVSCGGRRALASTAPQHEATDEDAGGEVRARRGRRGVIGKPGDGVVLHFLLRFKMFGGISLAMSNAREPSFTTCTHPRVPLRLSRQPDVPHLGIRKPLADLRRVPAVEGDVAQSRQETGVGHDRDALLGPIVQPPGEGAVSRAGRT